MDEKVYTLKDLEQIFPFGRNKLLQLCQVGALPVVKVGKSYISSPALIEEWLYNNVGKKIKY